MDEFESPAWFLATWEVRMTMTTTDSGSLQHKWDKDEGNNSRRQRPEPTSNKDKHLPWFLLDVALSGTGHLMPRQHINTVRLETTALQLGQWPQEKKRMRHLQSNCAQGQGLLHKKAKLDSTLQKSHEESKKCKQSTIFRLLCQQTVERPHGWQCVHQVALHLLCHHWPTRSSVLWNCLLHADGNLNFHQRPRTWKKSKSKSQEKEETRQANRQLTSWQATQAVWVADVLPRQWAGRGTTEQWLNVLQFGHMQINVWFCLGVSLPDRCALSDRCTLCQLDATNLPQCWLSLKNNCKQHVLSWHCQWINGWPTWRSWLHWRQSWHAESKLPAHISWSVSFLTTMLVLILSLCFVWGQLICCAS